MSKKIIFTDRSDSLLDRYLKDISKYKILSADETVDLILKAQKGDKKARDKVVNSNLRFVVTIAKQFQNRGVPLMDLISSGNEGLCKSVDKFLPDKGVVFLSYAVWWIRQCIYNTIYWHGKEIRLPISQQLLVINILETTTKFFQEHQRNPSPEEISEITGIPRNQIDYLSQFANKSVSVDDFIGGDDSNSQICEIIPDETKDLEELADVDFVRKELEKIIDTLTIREHDVITMLFGIGMEAINNKVVSDMFGVGNERIRQIKESALKKMKRRFSKSLIEMR